MTVMISVRLSVGMNWKLTLVLMAMFGR